jgi:hypothetical protein
LFQNSLIPAYKNCPPKYSETKEKRQVDLELTYLGLTDRSMVLEYNAAELLNIAKTFSTPALCECNCLNGGSPLLK